MNGRRTEALVAALAEQARPVAPLGSPVRRALLTLVPVGAAGAVLVLAAGDVRGMMARYSGREVLMAVEMTAMAATAVIAVLGAFALAVPGVSRRWLLAPLPALAVWIGASGAGCYADFPRLGLGRSMPGHAPDCLLFILAASLPIGGLMLWRLSRAKPIEPLPVALLGGLGAAALAALLLQFFHPFGLTAIDLGVHFAAVALVVALIALSRRQTLAPA
jgi:hypothetical protein